MAIETGASPALFGRIEKDETSKTGAVKMRAALKGSELFFALGYHRENYLIGLTKRSLE